MWAWIKRLFAIYGVPAQHKAAVERAFQYFTEVYGKKQRMSSHWNRVIGEEEGACIVRICYGHTLPPRRAFFRISPDLDNLEELPFRAVVKYGERSWR